MAHRKLLFALTMVVAAPPILATQTESAPAAPAAGPAARYCLRVAITGTRLDEVKCWTRQEWAEQEVDVDKEWAEEGVAVIEEDGRRIVKS